jgi:hypothetical protein
MICPRCGTVVHQGQKDQLCPQCGYFFKHEPDFYATMTSDGSEQSKVNSSHGLGVATPPAIIGILTLLGWLDVVLTCGGVAYGLNELAALPYGYEAPVGAYVVLVGLALGGLTSAALLFGFSTHLTLTLAMKAALSNLTQTRHSEALK